MTQLRHVLIGTTLDEASDAVVRAGVGLARAHGATVTLAHAYQPPGALFVTPMDAPAVPGDWLAAEAEELAARLTTQGEGLGLGAADRTELRPGPPHRVLEEVANSLPADLVVVGRAAAGRAILGSTSERLLRHLGCPVLVLHPTATYPPRRILVALDFSPISAAAFRRARQLYGAPETEYEVLFVLNVLERGAMQFGPEQLDRLASDELQRFVEQHAATAVVGRRVRHGSPSIEILAEIADWRTDLLVMGTHGRSGFQRLVVGSVAATVVRDAPCSALVVPPHHVTGAGASAGGADWAFVGDVAPPAGGTG
jgi:nucleotide-binding universal stress UspA family protein